MKTDSLNPKKLSDHWKFYRISHSSIFKKKNTSLKPFLSNQNENWTKKNDLSLSNKLKMEFKIAPFNKSRFGCIMVACNRSVQLRPSLPGSVVITFTCNVTRQFIHVREILFSQGQLELGWPLSFCGSSFFITLNPLLEQTMRPYFFFFFSLVHQHNAA